MICPLCKKEVEKQEDAEVKGQRFRLAECINDGEMHGFLWSRRKVKVQKIKVAD